MNGLIIQLSRKRRFKNELYNEFARLARAFASARRIELIEVLAQGARTVEALAAETDQPVANASQHLQILRQARLVESTRSGNFIRYRLADDRVLRLWFSLRDLGEANVAQIGRLVQSFFADRARFRAISIQELRRRIKDRDVVVVDVRPVLEYQAGHIQGARSVPIAELIARLKELPKNR